MIIQSRMTTPVLVWSLTDDRSEFRRPKIWGAAPTPGKGDEQGPSRGVYWNGSVRSMIEVDAQLNSAPPEAILSSVPMTIRDVVMRRSAVPDNGFNYVEPPMTADLYEVVEVRETRSLVGGTLYRNTLRPVFGQMLETVNVYQTWVDDPGGPSWNVRRGSRVYTGPASVKAIGERKEAYFAGAHVLETAMEVTFPLAKRTPWQMLGTAVIIEWTSPYGLVEIDAMTPVSSADDSPLWIRVTGIFRAPYPGVLA